MSYMVPNQTRTCFKKIFQTYGKTFLGQVVGLFLHSSFHWTNMCFNKISSGDNLGCICICSLNPDIKTLLLAISCFVYSHIFKGQDILKAYLCALLQSCFMAHIIWEESNSFFSSRKEVRSHLLSALNFCEKEFCSWTLRMQNRTTVFLNFLVNDFAPSIISTFYRINQ